MEDCLFCKLITKQIPADIVYEDDDVFAFNDITPQAPTHILVIPKQHISTINDAQDEALMGKLLITAKQIAKAQKFAKDGYRLVMNCGEGGGQTVYHIHLHILAGRALSWPPG